MSNLHFLPLLLTLARPLLELQRFLPCPTGRVGSETLLVSSLPPQPPRPGPSPHQTQDPACTSLRFGGPGGGGHFSPANVLLGLFQRSCVLCPQQMQPLPSLPGQDSWPPCPLVMLQVHRASPRTAFASRALEEFKTQAGGLLVYGPESSHVFLWPPPS